MRKWTIFAKTKTRVVRTMATCHFSSLSSLFSLAGRGWGDPLKPVPAFAGAQVSKPERPLAISMREQPLLDKKKRKGRAAIDFLALVRGSA